MSNALGILAMGIAAQAGGGGGGPTEYLKSAEVDGETLILTTQSDETVEYSPVKPYELNQLNKYLYEVTFSEIPEEIPSNDTLVGGGCTSFVKDGKLYRNLDWKYDEAKTFKVTYGDGEIVGTAFDYDTDDTTVSQLMYHLVDGANPDGIMVAMHVLYNDWEYEGSGEKNVPLHKIPYIILSELQSMDDIETVMADYLANIAVEDVLVEQEYLLHFIVTDGTTTYAIMPPESSTGSYVLQDISELPQLTNFRWVSDSTVNRADLQERPTGVERWNDIGRGLLDVRFTNSYEFGRLSDFIGIDGTTKDSTDEELQAICDEAKELYYDRTRDGTTWQTVHSVIYNGNDVEHFYLQEDYTIDYGSAQESFKVFILPDYENPDHVDEAKAVLQEIYEYNQVSNRWICFQINDIGKRLVSEVDVNIEEGQYSFKLIELDNWFIYRREWSEDAGSFIDTEKVETFWFSCDPRYDGYYLNDIPEDAGKYIVKADVNVEETESGDTHIYKELTWETDGLLPDLPEDDELYPHRLVCDVYEDDGEVVKELYWDREYRAGTNITFHNGIINAPENVSDFTNDAGYLTLDTLPIWDGGVE